MLRTLLAFALLASTAVATPAFAQAPPAGDPTLAQRGGARPGILQRPTTPEPDEEEEETDAPEAEPDTRQEPEAERPAAPARTTPPRGATQERDTRPDRNERVLDVEDIEPDIGDIDENFEEGFDPMDPPSNVRVNIDFREAELNDVVMWISALTGRNFIIADTINASKKITIISPQPVTIGEAYRAFIAALNMNGLTIVPFGRFLRIVEASGAERQVLDPTESIGQIPADDRMVTHIHQLQHVSIDTVQPVLDALKTEAASIIAYEPTNTLIITEAGLNLRRLLGLLDTLDVPSGQEQIFMYQVQYANAEDLKSLIEEIFSNEDDAQPVVQERPRRRSARSSDDDNSNAASEEAGGVAAVSVSQIIADERTNQLIIRANERSYERILEMLAQLDVPIPGEGQIHVLFLENADATELASTLQSLSQSIQDQREEGASRRGEEAAAADGGSVTATFSGELSITADEATNALVVVASLRDFLALRTVVDQLDRRRQQVYVEAVIMEVSLNRQNELGLAFNGGYDLSVAGESAPLFGATTLGGLSSLSIDPTSLSGLTLGLQGPGIDLGGISIPSIGAILQASQTDNDVNILSTPHILTMDNEEAEIIVGENIPFISGISSGLGSLGGLSGLAAQNGLDTSALGGLGGLGGFGGFGGVQVQRQDVALTLRITPQINESNYVRLEIEEEVEDVQSIDPVLGPRTTTRQARTTVVVRDQETIVIGGLMRDQQIEDVNKVPFFGDIPIIGRLFRNTSTRDVKTNLLLLLTPYIIRDSADFQAIFRRKMEEREEFLRYFGRRDIEYVQAVDYARKDGPMQRLYETIGTAIEEEEERRRAFSAPTQEAAIDAPEMQPLRIDMDDAGDDATGPLEAP